MSHFNDHRYNGSGRGENVPPINSAHSSASLPLPAIELAGMLMLNMGRIATHSAPHRYVV